MSTGCMHGESCRRQYDIHARDSVILDAGTIQCHVLTIIISHSSQTLYQFLHSRTTKHDMACAGWAQHSPGRSAILTGTGTPHCCTPKPATSLDLHCIEPLKQSSVHLISSCSTLCMERADHRRWEHGLTRRAPSWAPVPEQAITLPRKHSSQAAANTVLFSICSILLS